MIVWGGKFRSDHTPMVMTGETREMQESATPAKQSFGLAISFFAGQEWTGFFLFFFICNSSARAIRKTALRAYRGWRHRFTHKMALSSSGMERVDSYASINRPASSLMAELLPHKPYSFYNSYKGIM